MALVVAVALLPVLAVVGLATDSTVGFLARNRLGRALDAAGLAAARVLEEADVTADATEFFNANFPADYLNSTVDSFTVDFDQNTGLVTVAASASVPTYFMRLFGKDTLQVSARTVIERTNRGVEIALVLDITGSMHWNNKIAALRSAATDLVNILFGTDTEQPNLWISLVPYTAMVNIGTAHMDWLDAGDPAWGGGEAFLPGTWKGCVRARAGGEDETDTLPGFAPFSSFLWPSFWDNAWPPVNESNEVSWPTGPNVNCGQPIISLTNQRDDLLAGIAGLQAWWRGGTTGNLGLIWGLRTISPDWRGMWGGNTPAAYPLDYDEPLMDKVVIIMTDGRNQFAGAWWSPGGSDDTAYGRLNQFGYSTLAEARAELDTRTARICEDIKSRNITIYTITFGSSVDSIAQTLFQNCATNPGFYFHAPDSATLSVAFNSIGQRLSNLRIVE